jgi:hypothetical protein
MTAVLIIAMILGAAVGLDRWTKWTRLCRVKAGEHRELQEYFMLMADGNNPWMGFHPNLSAKYVRRAIFHSGMRRKWERAAGRPWERIPPDPPEPQ